MEWQYLLLGTVLRDGPSVRAGVSDRDEFGCRMLRLREPSLKTAKYARSVD